MFAPVNARDVGIVARKGLGLGRVDGEVRRFLPFFFLIDLKPRLGKCGLGFSEHSMDFVGVSAWQ